MKALGDRLYRGLLCAFPYFFRRRYGDAMAAQFAEQRRRVRGRPMATAALWVRACVDVAWHGISLRLESRRAAYPGDTRTRRPAWWNDAYFWRDVRQACRALRRSPAYGITVVCIATLSTALGATVFATVDGVLFKKLPYPDADRLYVAWARGADGRAAYVFKLNEIDALRRANPALSIAAFQPPHGAGTLGDGRTYDEVAVDDSFFGVLGARPIVGGFVPEQFHPGAARVAVISFRLWQRVFNGRPDAIGQVLPLAGASDHLGRPATQPIVVGILGPDFVFPSYRLPDIVMPLALTSTERAGRNESIANALVRLPPGTPAGQWQSRLDATIREVQPSGPTQELMLDGASLEPVIDLARPMMATFRTLIIAAAFLAVLACLGIAGLSIARARQRTSQVLVRRALGASSWDLFRHGLAEIVPLAFAGASIGGGLTPGILKFTLAMLPPQMPLLKTPRFDVRVAWVAVAISVTTALVVSLAVLWATRRVELNATPGSVTPRARGFGRTLISGQVALAFVVTLAGALLTMSLWRAWQVDPGYDRERLAVVRIVARGEGGPDIQVEAKRMAGELASLPGVAASGLLSSPLLTHSRSVSGVKSSRDAASVDLSTIYFGGELLGTLGVVPSQGRLPSRDEVDREEPVVLMSERGAASVWPGDAAVGRSVFIGQSPVTVVGVVRDLKFSGLADRDRSAGQIFIPGVRGRQFALLARTEGSPRDIAALAARQTLAHRDRFDLVSSGTMTEALADSIEERQFSAWVYGGYAFCALAITAVGILGMVSMLTALRTREIGTRQALGAGRARIVWLLLQEQLVGVAMGLVAGGVGAWWAVETVRRQLYGVAATDPVIWSLTALAILVSASLATLVPAIRAALADPAQTLRADG